MEKDVRQLVEMGATAARARAALKQYKDVMRAAERIFDGEFDFISREVEEDVRMDGASVMETSGSKPKGRLATPQDDEDDGMDDEDDGDAFVDYDSDFETPGESTKVADVDPYSGIFFSKDRREEVVEVEEESEIALIPEINERVKLMTQGQWMKGCPEGGEQSFLFSLYTQLSEGDCPCPRRCGSTIARKKSDFFAVFSDFTAYIEHIRRLVRQTCRICQTVFCFACGEPDMEEKTRRPTAAEPDALFHCSGLQGVILGIGLAMLEQIFSEQLHDSIDDPEQKSRNAKRRKVDIPIAIHSLQDADDSDDLYYHARGKGPKGGVGYAGNQQEDNSWQAEAQAIQRSKDEKVGLLMSSIRTYLPNLRRPGGGQASDYLVHPTALAHLRRRFNVVCSSLLRNDSLSDMSDRSILYFELFEWLETISNHEALASMMAMPIMISSSVKAVTTKRPSRNHAQIRERRIVYEGSSGPRELLEAIVIQAQAAVKGLEGIKPPEDLPGEMTEEQKRMTADIKGKMKEEVSNISDENLKLLKFCHRILSTAEAIDRSLRENKGDAFVDRLHASLPKIHAPTSDTQWVEAGVTEEATTEAYVQWATRIRFEYCDLTVPHADNPIPKTDEKDEDLTPHYKFYYNNEARMLANSDIPKRSLAIAKELAVLTTNLPVAWNSSIFLRVDETRVDVIKALITGPEGTPYHNGCYLFDIFLGSSYNQSPPSVKYMTTNGGRFRFNPNLYADGKVCLSLLGTWQGPGWIPGRSTLLQVLISIQSMILCEEPYLNEPGWASSGGTPQSLAYSANVRRMVVKTAMLGNLKNPPEPFADVIRTHFRLKARSVATQLDQWLAQDDGKPTSSDGGGYHAPRQEATSSSGDFQRDVTELKQLLEQLQSRGH